MAKIESQGKRKGSSKRNARNQNLNVPLQLSAVERKRLSEEPIQDIQDIVTRHDSWQEVALRQGRNL